MIGKLGSCYCPMGCGETLEAHIVAGVAAIVCSNEACPDQNIVAAILDDEETEHIVVLDDNYMLTSRHPLKERIGEGLFSCALHDWIEGHTNWARGTYRVVWDQEGHNATWERIETVGKA